MAVVTLALARQRYAWLGIVPLAWLLVVSVPYLVAATDELPNPNYWARTRTWQATAAIAAVAVLGGAAAATRRELLGRLYAWTVLAAAGALLGAILVAGRAAAAFAVVLWLVLLGWALGERALRLLFRGAPPRDAEAALLAVGLALGLYSHAILGLALLGLLDRWLVAALLAGLSIACWRDLLGKARLAARLVPEIVRRSADPAAAGFALPLLAILVGWAVLVLILAVAPETTFSSLNYHLALPRTYIDQRGFVLTPYDVQSWVYLGAEMSYLLGMLLVDQVAAKLTNVAFLLLTAGAVLAFGTAWLARRAGVLAAALYATAPIVAWEASTTYVEVALAFYGLLAGIAAHRWLVDRRAAWLIAAGLLMGFALSTKVNALFLAAPLGALVGVIALADRRRTLGRRLLPPLVFGAAFLLAGAPWPLLRYAQTGNPVFPFYNEVFRSPLSTEGRQAAVPGYGFDYRDLVSLARLPWDVTFRSDRHGSTVSSTVGLGLLVAPLALLARPRTRSVLFVAALALLFYLFWAFTLRFIRFLVPGLPLIYLLAGQALAVSGHPRQPVPGSRLSAGLVGALVLTWLVLGLPLFLEISSQIPERLPYEVGLGLEPRERYLSRVVRTYDAYRFIDEHNRGRPIHILAINDSTRLYSSGIVETTVSPYAGPVLRARDEAEALQLIRARGFTHLLVRRRRLSENLATRVILRESFLQANAELQYDRDRVEVYRFRGPGEEAPSGERRRAELQAGEPARLGAADLHPPAGGVGMVAGGDDLQHVAAGGGVGR